MAQKENRVGWKIDDDLTRVLLAFTLCKDAINAFHVLQNHIIAAIFYSAIMSYYSVFKKGKESNQVKRLIFNPPNGTWMHLEYPITAPDGVSLGLALRRIFVKYEERRDKNIAHRDKRKRHKEDGGVWLQVPDNLLVLGHVQQFKKGNGIYYVGSSAIVKPDYGDLQEFCALVRFTADILAQKKGRIELHEYDKTPPRHS